MKRHVLFAIVIGIFAVTCLTAYGVSGIRHLDNRLVSETNLAVAQLPNNGPLVFHYVNESDAGLGQIMGDAIDPKRNDAPVVGITVDIFEEDYTPVDSTTTDSDGKFSFSNLDMAIFIVVMDNPNYRKTELWVEVDTDEVIQLPPFWCVPEPVIVPGGAKGKVYDTISGEAISSVTLEVREGLNVPDTAPIVYTTATGTFDRSYEITDLNAGVYTVFASKIGYRDGTFLIYILGDEIVSPQDGTLSPALYGDEMRIVLTWNASPSDLDSHIWGPVPPTGSLYHVYYGNNGSHPYTFYFDLDLDDVSSYGPETTTIYNWYPDGGTYCFLVHDYSNRSSSYSKAMTNSGAMVTILTEETTLTFYPTPDTEGTVWSVFTVDGTSFEITPVNDYYYQSNVSSVGQECQYIDLG